MSGATSLCIENVTALINTRMGKGNEGLHVTKEFVDKIFEFSKLKRSNLLTFIRVIKQELELFGVENALVLDVGEYQHNLGTDERLIAKLLEAGVIRFEWRESPMPGRMAINNGKPPSSSSNNGGVDAEDEEQYGPNTFATAFQHCLTIAADSSDDTEAQVEKSFESAELFVCFDIDKMARYEGFAELTILPVVSRFVVEGLHLSCKQTSLPVKPRRRNDYGHVWCQLQCSFESFPSPSSRKDVANFAKQHLRRSDNRVPMRYSVYFALDDAVDLSNPWGSCPLLHVGSNVKTPNFSRWFHENTGERFDAHNSSNTCFVYSQKAPTIEVPSKLKTETEIVMRGAVEDGEALFGGARKPSTSRLAAAMALSHPKSRIRHMANAYLSIHLARSFMTNRTVQCNECYSVCVGTDALIIPPQNDSDAQPTNDTFSVPPLTAVVEGAPERLVATTPVQRNGMSRKMSVASYNCLACPGREKCAAEIDWYTASCSGIRASNDYSCFRRSTDTRRCQNSYCNSTSLNNTWHLSHTADNGHLDILENGKICRVVASAVCPNNSRAASSEYALRNCEGGAVSHLFFCSGVVPCSASFSPATLEKNTLVLFGKHIDVINDTGGVVGHQAFATSASNSSKMRRRVFYEKDDNKIPATPSEALSAFKDIVVHECDPIRYKEYMKHNRITHSKGVCSRRWLNMVDLHRNFSDQVKNFYTELAKAEAMAKTTSGSLNDACKQLFRIFKRKCIIFEREKNALLSNHGHSSVSREDENWSETDSDSDSETMTECANIVFDTLRQHFYKYDAAINSLMEKCVFLGSRTIVSGVRCIVTNNNGWKFDVRQYVVVMAGSVIASVSTDHLRDFTPVEGAVSATTAPNDKLPDRAHLTWDGKKKVPLIFDRDTPSIRCDNWRTAQKPLAPTHMVFRQDRPLSYGNDFTRRKTLEGRDCDAAARSNSSLAPSPTTSRYVIPHLR